LNSNGAVSTPISNKNNYDSPAYPPVPPATPSTNLLGELSEDIRETSFIGTSDDNFS
jgi:hypothetical protein